MDIKEQVKIFKKGLIDLISEKELIQKLETGRPLRIKYGADPSKPDLHLGHTVPLNKLRELQELGHIVVFLVGDFTALLGDPSFKSETRPMLSQEEVEANARTYQNQVFKILDKSKTEVVANSQWLNQMTPRDLLDLASKYTVARVLERDDFQKRFNEKTPISVSEFLYPLLQGYDSVILKNDIEIGGTDQKFNLLVGRELQKDWGIDPQVVMTLPIIEGTDGVQKMSKSLGNAIAIEEAPGEMFGKLMSIPDNLILPYLTYLTKSDEKEIKEAEKALKGGENPRNLKALMAKKVISHYHGDDAAEEASLAFDRLFKEKKTPEDIEEHFVTKSPYKFIEILHDHKMVGSKGEAKRLIQQSGVKVNGEKVTDVDFQVEIAGETLIQCGKRKFARFRSKKG